MKTAAEDTTDSEGADKRREKEKEQSPEQRAKGLYIRVVGTDERPEGPDRVYGRRARAQLMVDTTPEDGSHHPRWTRRIRNPEWKKNRV
jgi:hypothetical protein